MQIHAERNANLMTDCSGSYSSLTHKAIVIPDDRLVRETRVTVLKSLSLNK